MSAGGLVHHSEDMLGHSGQGDTLFIYFTSMKTNWGETGDERERFDFLATVQRENQNALLIRDRRNCWFHMGVDGCPGGAMELAAFLAGHSQRFSHTILSGSSMGGYAALLFGHLMRPDLAVAFSPQIRIGTEAARALSDPRFEEYYPAFETATPTPEFLHLDRVLSTSRERMIAFCGAEGWVDVQHLELLKDCPAVKRVYLPQASHHEVARYSQSSGVMQQFFDGSYLRTGELYLPAV